MKNILIFGSGGHAKVAFSEIIQKKNCKILGFVDDFSKKGKLIIKHKNKSYYNLGKIINVIKYYKNQRRNKKKTNSKREEKGEFRIIGIK